VVDTLWMAPTLNAEIACECIASGTTEEIIASKRQELRRRAQRMETELSGYKYRYVPDSMFVWVTLPDYWRSVEFERTANVNGVNVISSDKFSVGSIVPPNCVRISLSGPGSMEEFEEGLAILRKILSFEIGSAGGVI
jgi:DNA-binding transcriptional MocR family regulator